MSGFVGSTPVMRLVLRNPFLGTVFPPRGSALSVVDTGYDGFVAVPMDVFSSLGLDRQPLSRRTVIAADGHPINMEYSMASVDLPSLGFVLDGPVESASGLEELLVGTKLLRRFRLTLDYCGETASAEPCF